MNKYLKKISKTMMLFFILILLYYNTIVTTYEDEYKVIKQFGKIQRITTKPGASFKFPIFQTVSSIPKSLQFYALQESDVITSDKKTMIVNAYVTWKVTDPKKFTQSLNANIITAKNRIDVIIYNTLKTTISRMSQEEVIQSRDDMINYIGGSCNEYGITITRIDIKKLDLPSENKEAVYNRMITERENIAAAYTAQGNAEAQLIKNTTDKEVAIKISKAQAEADKLEAEGEAEYMKILSKAYNSKAKEDFYLYVRSLDAAKNSLSENNNTLILSKDSPIAKIFSNTEQ